VGDGFMRPNALKYGRSLLPQVLLLPLLPLLPQDALKIQKAHVDDEIEEF
jgi:hypothetical protein